MSKFDVRLGDKVVLKALSHHGKNRLREHGDTWRVKDIWPKKFLLESEKTQDLRWIEEDRDRDFEIIKVIV